MLVLTAIDSAQTSGALPDVLWINDACIAAAAFEAAVLSLGLAHRALDLRRDLDLARAQADADAFTGVLNRRAWTERLRQRVREAARAEQPLCVLFLDLDRFKSLNDNFGHRAGDDALLAFVAVLRDPSQPRAEVGRYGGEEFTVALPGCDLEQAQRYAGRARGRLRGLGIAVDAGGRPLTVSIGIAELAPGEDTASLIARADAAMYAAKNAGRDCVMLAAAPPESAAAATR
uniref:diguanylate cyclase n=1 Tax=Mizugakiibacter sediminis TaxID=1475481 RepID=A0A0S6YY69_9GAMM